MSNYCTNCRWLDKDLSTREDICRNAFPNRNLQRIHGNPIKLLQCINENWYEVKVKQQEKKMTTEEMIKVMQGYVDGKQIQVRFKQHQKWDDIAKVSEWDWYAYNYRIKPEPKYRPLKPEELTELKGKWLKHKNDNIQAMATLIKETEIYITGLGYYRSVSLFNNWTYEDGTPCGKLEE